MLGKDFYIRYLHDPGKLLGLALACSALVYAQTLSFQFVYDDVPLIVENPLIKNVSNVPLFFSQEDFLDGSHTGYYRPLIPFFYLADYLVWGLNPFGYHLTNLLLHLCVVALVFSFARRIFDAPVGAFWTSLFFGLHPANTEAVTFITGRNNVICAVFILLSVLSYLKYRDAGGRGWFALSLVSFFLGLLAKEFALFVPIMLVSLDVVQRRIRRRDAWIYPTFLLPLMAYLLMRAAVLNDALGVRLTIGELPRRMFDAVGIMASYLRLSVFPIGQKALYAIQSIPVYQTALALAGIIVILLVLYRQRHHRWLMIASVWYFLFLLPVLNIIPLSGSPMAERYLYVPLIGMAVGFGGMMAATPGERTMAPLRLFALLFLAGFALLTVIRNPVWKNDESLYGDMIRTTPSSYKGYYNLGEVRYKQGDRDGAKQLWEKVLEVRPDMMAVHNNLGVLYEETGDYGRAEAHYRAVLNVRSMSEVVRNLGNVLAKQGRHAEAEESYQRAILLEPRNLKLYTSLISHYESRQKPLRALDTALAAIKQLPDSSEAHNIAGTVYGGMKRYDEALRYFQKAVELDPQCYECRYNVSAVNRLLKTAK